MDKFQIVEHPDQMNLGPKWSDSEMVNVENAIGIFNGRQYRIRGKQRKLTCIEVTLSRLVGIVLNILTCTLCRNSKLIDNLLQKDIVIKRFGIEVSENALPPPERNPEVQIDIDKEDMIAGIEKVKQALQKLNKIEKEFEKTDEFFRQHYNPRAKEEQKPVVVQPQDNKFFTNGVRNNRVDDSIQVSAQKFVNEFLEKEKIVHVAPQIQKVEINPIKRKIDVQNLQRKFNDDLQKQEHKHKIEREKLNLKLKKQDIELDKKDRELEAESKDLDERLNQLPPEQKQDILKTVDDLMARKNPLRRTGVNPLARTGENPLARTGENPLERAGANPLKAKTKQDPQRKVPVREPDNRLKHDIDKVKLKEDIDQLDDDRRETVLNAVKKYTGKNVEEILK